MYSQSKFKIRKTYLHDRYVNWKEPFMDISKYQKPHNINTVCACFMPAGKCNLLVFNQCPQKPLMFILLCIVMLWYKYQLKRSSWNILYTKLWDKCPIHINYTSGEMGVIYSKVREFWELFLQFWWNIILICGVCISFFTDITNTTKISSIYHK